MNDDTFVLPEESLQALKWRFQQLTQLDQEIQSLQDQVAEKRMHREALDQSIPTLLKLALGIDTIADQYHLDLTRGILKRAETPENVTPIRS